MAWYLLICLLDQLSTVSLPAALQQPISQGGTLKAMDAPFYIERLYVPAGEGHGTVGDDTYFFSMSEGPATFIEWSAGGGYKRRRKRVFAGDLWVWPAGQTWWTRTEAAKTCISLFLSSRWLQGVTHTAFKLVPQVQLQDELLTQTLRALAQALDLSQNPTTKLYQESLVTTLALHLEAHYARERQKTQEGRPFSSVQLQRVSSYIAEHLSETLSLSDLAQLTGLSISQFSLRFRNTTGQTPHRFVTAMRVERARDLLVTGRYPIAEIAVRTGFADQSHLTRHVRRALGVTPSVLKKQTGGVSLAS